MSCSPTLPAGEISDALLYRMARDGAEDGRRMVVFVAADCDPAGHQMAVSIGRKLQALRDFRFPELEFEVVPVALTVEQVRDLHLPSTPLKDTAKRADRWIDAFGVGQTEIDALATLRPRELAEIVTTAIAPYFDASLAARVASAKSDWLRIAQHVLQAQVDQEVLQSIRQHAAIVLARFDDEIAAINEHLNEITRSVTTLPALVIPTHSLDKKQEGQALLISSAWSWATASRALMARKSYGQQPHDP